MLFLLFLFNKCLKARKAFEECRSSPRIMVTFSKLCKYATTAPLNDRLKDMFCLFKVYCYLLDFKVYGINKFKLLPSPNAPTFPQEKLNLLIYPDLDQLEKFMGHFLAQAKPCYQAYGNQLHRFCAILLRGKQTDRQMNCTRNITFLAEVIKNGLTEQRSTTFLCIYPLSVISLQQLQICIFSDVSRKTLHVFGIFYPFQIGWRMFGG